MTDAPNLYRLTLGEYSDRSEKWYQHERHMTQAEFRVLLETTWEQVTRPRLDARPRSTPHEAEFYHELMKDAGFVGIEPLAEVTLSDYYTDNTKRFGDGLMSELERVELWELELATTATSK